MKDFQKIILPFENNLFNELLHSADFEITGKGRLGNHLVDVKEKGVPIVRTTTIYNIPANQFSVLHQSIIASLNAEIQKNSINNLSKVDFNNALIEVYDSNYATMKYHSDQALDLEEGSYIGLFSCYENPEELSEKNLRKLKVKDKATDEEFDIVLNHNSVVLFPLSANTAFLHKIILESVPKQKTPESNKWLGITFRKSKTFIQFEDNMPRFSNGELLELADEDQKTEFYKLRGQENFTMDFIYPELLYTLSISDTMLPK